MSEPPQNRLSFAKVAVVMATCLLVGLGLCGLDIVLGTNGIGKPHGEFGVGPLDGISLVVMILSAAGLALTLILWALVAIVQGIGSEDGKQ
jgi:hypothetical protein